MNLFTNCPDCPGNSERIWQIRIGADGPIAIGFGRLLGGGAKIKAMRCFQL